MKAQIQSRTPSQYMKAIERRNIMSLKKMEHLSRKRLWIKLRSKTHMMRLDMEFNHILECCRDISLRFLSFQYCFCQQCTSTAKVELTMDFLCWEHSYPLEIWVMLDLCVFMSSPEISRNQS